MTTIMRIIILLIAIGGMNANAGQAPVSYSKVRGLLLGEPFEAYIDFGYLNEHMSSLVTACSESGTLWAFGLDAPLSCNICLVEGGNGIVYRFSINAKEGIVEFKRRFILYSTKPFQEGAHRKASEKEVGDVLKLLDNQLLTDLVPPDKAVLGGLDAIEWLHGETVILLVPLLSVINEFDEEEPRTLVVVRRKGGPYMLNDIIGTIHGFPDIDGDGNPEVILESSCDGVCVSVVSIDGTGEFVSIAAH